MLVSRSIYVFFFKQKTAYEMRISDWSSDVCSSDLGSRLRQARRNRSSQLQALDHYQAPKSSGGCNLSLGASKFEKRRAHLGEPGEIDGRLHLTHPEQAPRRLVAQHEKGVRQMRHNIEDRKSTRLNSSH